MCSNRRNAQIGIGLSVMGLSLLSNPFFSPAGIGYMMHLIYKDYVELTLGAVTELKQPPPYDGSAEKIDISIKT
ncbi:uncharacterized protein LOC115760961 isoform X2 [Drosophila novamexicana]|uniref:uncharacterized protein LOC115760961 isoform X2 n=1 Tax=Drosophila novamexicana TaxID=47314 RepID=UPI0011E5B407|nr:uncharacterized protein LOC115760961 isoform X2 [Drosophila novamexicana]